MIKIVKEVLREQVLDYVNNFSFDKFSSCNILQTLIREISNKNILYHYVLFYYFLLIFMLKINQAQTSLGIANWSNCNSGEIILLWTSDILISRASMLFIDVLLWFYLKPLHMHFQICLISGCSSSYNFHQASYFPWALSTCKKKYCERDALVSDT